MNTKNYTTSPLPFQGQKRRFAKQFTKVITDNPSALYVDLFGGSGLLSHLAKTTHPDARVVYNDFVKDYLDVLLCPYDSSYIFFTSNKSNIIELCEWIETNTGGVNPFSGAITHTMQVAPTYNTSYADVMIYKYV